MGNVLALQRFGADFPRVYMDANIKGWFVSSLLLGAWLGSLLSGPLCDRLGRKRSIMWQVLVFTLGSGLQTGATAEAHMFAGRIIAGLSIGSLTHIVPMYIAELAPAAMRGALVALQQLSITLGILFSYWIAYGTSHIGGTRCAPDVPYSGPKGADGHATFDAYRDVPPGGCTGQGAASWRVPVGIQLLPGLILGVGMFFMPYSPRWLVEVGRDDEAKATLSRLRSLPVDDPDVIREYVEIKAEIVTIRQIREARGAGKSGFARAFQPYVELLSTKSNFHRLYIGCTTMFFQQFIGCNAIIYVGRKAWGLADGSMHRPSSRSLAWTPTRRRFSPRACTGSRTRCLRCPPSSSSTAWAGASCSWSARRAASSRSSWWAPS